jgi:hypothetical protein
VLRSVRGGSKTDVWAVGDGGTTLHFDGLRWTKFESGSSNGLNGIWVGAEGGVWAVGEGGSILRR